MLAAVGAPVLGEALKERAGASLALILCFAISLALGGLDIKLPQRATWTEVAPIEPITSTERVHVSPGLHVLSAGMLVGRLTPLIILWWMAQSTPPTDLATA